MKSVLLQAVGFCVIILLGYLMKRFNVLSKADGSVLAQIIVTITLPATIIVTLNPIKVTTVFFLLLIAGFVMNVITILIGNQLGKHRNTVERKFQVYVMSGYNIGNFSLPFIQGFYPMAVPFLCMFDIGNSVMLTGGTTILSDKLIGESKKRSLKETVGMLFKSVPFSVYVVMFFLRLGDVQLSDSLLSILKLIANANGFLSMFMIGLYLELRLPKKAFQVVKTSLIWRYVCGGVFAILFAFILPLPQILRVVLVLLSVAPMPTFSVISSVKSGTNEEVAGFASSMSIFISLVLMTLVMMLMK